MNEEEFLQKIKGIKVNVPDEQFFLEYNAVVYNILKENQQLKEQIKSSEEENIIDKKIDEYAERINNNPRYDDLEPIEFREHLIHIKEQLEKSEKARKEAIEYINKHAYFDEEMTSINALGIENIKKVLDILDIDKGE